MADANPVQVQKALAGLHYPASKEEVLDYAESGGAEEEVMSVLRQLPPKDFETPADVSKEIGKLE